MDRKNIVGMAGLPAVLSTATLLLLFPAFTAARFAQTYTLGNPFDDSYRSIFKILGDASVNGDALQLTPDTRSNVSFLMYKSGRALYPEPFRLWTRRSRRVLRASFQTSFDLNMFRDPEQETAGEGMAFIIVPDADTMPLNSWGGYLGLTNATTDGNDANQLVAIELDTFKQPYDPEDNHVGLDLNGVTSIQTSSAMSFNLSDLNINLVPSNASIYRVWVDYDGPSANLKVYINYTGQPKPANPILRANLDLSQHVASSSYLGFAASTGKHYQLNAVLAWNISVEAIPGGQSRVQRILQIVLPITAGVAVALALTAATRHIRKKRSAPDGEHLTGKLQCLPGMPRELPYKDLKRATGGFDAKNKLGQGGFGVVYRGVLPGGNTPVAVKKFSRETMRGDFLAELTIISRLRNKHLVRLLGWGRKHGKAGKLLLVYEYMPNGSLDAHLFGQAPAGITLRWEQRYTILRDVASALRYLHDEYDQKVIHRDLKSSNIMLDADFSARLGDFGLARAIDDDRTSYADAELEGVPGTLGYIAPECFYTGKATRESDVFGFGAVVLEVVCGRRPRCDVDGFRFLADWVWRLHAEGRIRDAVDSRLGDGGYGAEDAERLLLLGLACSHPIPGERPKANAVVQIISRSVPPPHVPPFRPALVLPAGPAEEEVVSIDTMATE